MKNLAELFQSRSFWFYYQSDDEPEPDPDLAQGFAERRPDGEGFEPVVFQFPCPLDSSLELEAQLDYYYLALQLQHGSSVEPAVLGWWDEGRWHPFALRWDELQALVRYWDVRPEAFPLGASVALLLLAPFVGTGVDEADLLPERLATIEKAYRSLGLFSEEEITGLAHRTLRIPTEDDYRWKRDPDLGWVFGGEYPCYSLRNPEHAGGEEGLFPFAEFDAILMAAELGESPSDATPPPQ